MAHPKPDPAPIVLIPALIGGVLTARTQDPLGLGEGGEAPAAVTDLAAGTPAATSVTLTFTLPAGATATFYRRDVTADGEYEQIATGVAVGSYTPTGLTPDENIYQFKNTLTNDYGTSADSNVVSVTTAEIGESPLFVNGTYAQGNTAAIETDGTHNLNIRSTKPLYVFDGVNKAGSSWGRLTGDYWHAASTLSATETVGEMPNAIRWDFKGTNASIMEDLIPFDATKPYRQSTARFYDFDIADPLTHGDIGFNLKTDRWWRDESVSLPDLYIGYQGSNGATSSRIGVEGIENPGNYYGAGVPVSVWTRELMLFKNSTANDVPDGFCKHFRDGVWLNFEDDIGDLSADKHHFITRDATYPNGMAAKAFDQVSNGSGNGVAEVVMHFGYLLIDDEIAGVFAHNQSTITSNQVLEYQIPHGVCTDTSIPILCLCPYPANEIYLYILLSNGAWLTTTGLKAVPA